MPPKHAQKRTMPSKHAKKDPMPLARAASSSISKFGPAALLTIRVGEGSEQQDFVAHESFLTSRSEFFRRAVNGHWEEAQTRVVKLPEDSPETFGIYLDCVYTNKMSTAIDERPSFATMNQDMVAVILHADVTRLLPIYTLADKLMDNSTKDIAMRALYDVLHDESEDEEIAVPLQDYITYVYNYAPENSPIRRLMVDLWMGTSAEALQELGSDAPKDFLLDLAVAFLRLKNPADRHFVTERKGVKAYL